MGIALISSNTTLKVSAAVSISANTVTAGAALYTVPANSYALLMVWIGGSGGALGGDASSTYVASGESAKQVVVGPGGTIKSWGANSQPFIINGVVFVNSP